MEEKEGTSGEASPAIQPADPELIRGGKKEESERRNVRAGQRTSPRDDGEQSVCVCVCVCVYVCAHVCVCVCKLV